MPWCSCVEPASSSRPCALVPSRSRNGSRSPIRSRSRSPSAYRQTTTAWGTLWKKEKGLQAYELKHNIGMCFLCARPTSRPFRRADQPSRVGRLQPALTTPSGTSRKRIPRFGRGQMADRPSLLSGATPRLVTGSSRRIVMARTSSIRSRAHSYPSYRY